MARFFFNRRGADAETADHSRRITAVTRASLALTEADGVSVSEIACAHPECGDAETVILVMRPGKKTEAVKIQKAMRLATDAEVDAALSALKTQG